MLLSLDPIGRRSCAIRLLAAGLGLSFCLWAVAWPQVVGVSGLWWKIVGVSCAHVAANALARRSHHLRLHSFVWATPLTLLGVMALHWNHTWSLRALTAMAAAAILATLLLTPGHTERPKRNAGLVL